MRARAGRLDGFGWMELPVGAPPDWLANARTGRRADPARHWSEIPDFDPAFGDIKLVWEPSRFDWAPLFARAALTTGDAAWIQLLNQWIADWCAANPANLGPNWKCGQECSLRLLAVLESGRLLDREPHEAVPFVAAHLARIAISMGYALAQQNNHATSEAAALFVGGAWLAERAEGNPAGRGVRWRDLGRRQIDRCVARLISPDGGFSQGSANYHRLMLDALSTAELWRRRLDQPPFSPATRERLAAAAEWLRVMTDPDTGRAPNLGANDGAWLWRVDGCGYEDFRPSVQRACRLFRDKAPYPPGPWDPQSPAESAALRGSRLFPQSGYAVLEAGRSWAVMRAPNARFRPAQADALHVDLWRDGRAVFSDGGSYSYFGLPQWTDYFPSALAHNGPVFDGQDAMPRIGRFLYADWIETIGDNGIAAADGCQSWAARYQTRDGRRCRRRMTLGPDSAEIEDEAEGQRESLVLRFRLRPGDWRLEDGICTDGRMRITVSGVGVATRLVPDWESRRYHERTETTALVCTLGPRPQRVVTRIAFGD